MDTGRVALRTRPGPVGLGWGTPRLKNVGGQEAMVKAHGVTMAKVQGHSWVPIRLIGHK